MCISYEKLLRGLENVSDAVSCNTGTCIADEGNKRVLTAARNMGVAGQQSVYIGKVFICIEKHLQVYCVPG